MAEYSKGQRVRVVLEGTVAYVTSSSKLLEIRSGEVADDYTHVVNTETVESITVIRKPWDFAPGSIIWVTVKDQPGTEQVVVLKSFTRDDTKVFMSLTSRQMLDPGKVVNLTGVDYDAPEHPSTF